MLAGGHERRIGREGRDDDFVRHRPIELDQVAFRALRDREDTLGLADGAADEDLEGREVPEAEHARIPFPGEVLHGDDRGARATQRQRMDEVRNVRPEPPQETRKRHGHA